VSCDIAIAVFDTPVGWASGKPVTHQQEMLSSAPTHSFVSIKITPWRQSVVQDAQNSAIIRLNRKVTLLIQRLINQQ
jgi:hypothetical protein